MERDVTPGWLSRPWVQDLIVAMLAVLAYSNCLANGFHLDDYYRIVDNPGIGAGMPWWRHFIDPRTSSTLLEITPYRPLLPLTLSWERALAGGDDLFVYHLGNLAMQVLAALAVRRLMTVMLRHARPQHDPAPMATWVAAAFALHPIAGILVNYLSARDQILMLLFVAIALNAAVRLVTSGPSPARRATLVVATAAGLLAKTDAAVMPAMVLALEVTLGGRSLRSWAPWRHAALAAAPVLAFVLWTHFGLHFSDLDQVRDPRASAWFEYPLTQARVHVTAYLPNLFWPLAIHMGPAVATAHSPWEPTVLLGIAWILATLTFAWINRRRRPLLAFAVLAFWIVQAPSSSFLPLYAARVDYRPYPALPFALLAIGLLASDWLPALARWVAGGATLAALAAVTLYMNTIWRNDETLWSHSVRLGGDALAHHNLAMAIPDRRDPRIRTHLEEALRLSPDYILAHVNLGLWLVGQGDIDAGIKECRHAVDLDPRQARSYYWLARALRAAGQMPQAAEATREAVRLAPDNLVYRYQALFDAQDTGAFGEALAHAESIVAVDPWYQEVLFAQAFALQKLGRPAAAVPVYQRFLERHDRNPQAWFNLGYALAELLRWPEAAHAYSRVLELRPDYHEAHLHLATCLDHTGDVAGAARHRRLYEAR